MASLAVIALSKSEHRQLTELWRFFPFSGSTVYHYAHLGAAAPETLPQRPDFIARAFSGSAQDALPHINDWLAELAPDLLCFCGLDSFRLWARDQALPWLTLYAGKRRALADLSAGADLADPLALLHCESRQVARLAAESSTGTQSPDSAPFADYHSWHINAVDSILFTGNRDLISAVCHSQLTHYRISHHWLGGQAANLALDDVDDQFQHALFVLLKAGRMATLDPADRFKTGAQLPAPPAYAFFAEYYDKYMSHVDYEDWLTLMLNWYKKFSPRAPRSVLELACGTANASELLVFRGYEVDACDSSPYMLHMADAKVFKPRLFLASLTDPLPAKDYDFVFCLFDSINYITQKAELKTLLHHVHRALRPGGIFIFDISTIHNSLHNFADTTSFTRVRDGYLVQISNYEVLANKQFTRFHLFRQSGDAYQNLEERHVQRVYRSPELAELIAASPLRLKAVFTPETRANLLGKLHTELDNRHSRLFFLLQKDA